VQERGRVLRKMDNKIGLDKLFGLSETAWRSAGTAA
jgi:hypothetical protein